MFVKKIIWDYFNSTLVQFKLFNMCNSCIISHYFNSTLVQFKQEKIIPEKEIIKIFQFYFSPIQTFQALRPLYSSSLIFQFYFSPIQTFALLGFAFAESAFQFYFSPIQTQNCMMIQMHSS